MDVAIFLAWYLCGIIAVHIGSAVDKAQGETPVPQSVWLAVFGPIALFLVLVEAVRVATREKPNGTL